ncbi:TIGR01457 family HAD-type hydrolase [Jeotgalibaca sp. A127]|uniref:TIGR01457 family HAD-type hydrolase n=1 Tax=Jeotgalibaca sp. A127 TaxID=3457324 RepID=UPI003FCFFE6C
MKQYKGFFIDLDGTVYAGTDPIPTAKTFISELEARGIPYLYVTNNATKTQEDVVEHLKAVSGIDASAENVYTSGLAAVDYAKKTYPGARTFVVGEPALQAQVEEAGLVIVEDDIEVVIQGLDRFASYQKLATASTAIRNGAAFIATNPDVNLPTEKGMMPGAGSLTAFLKTSTQKEPIIIGKPYGYIMDGALERIGLAKEEVAMIGDNYHTDILAGMNFGVDTILALTGVTKPEELSTISNKPTYTLNDLSEWRFE